MKKILITGGAGFIGSHLCKRLLKDGHEVICMDNFFTGSKKNVNQLLDNPNFEIIRHDVIMPYSIEVDEIYNLACPASPVAYQHDPVNTINSILMGSINALELAKRLKAKILQASTSEIYGDPLESPQSESYHGNVSVTSIRACYDEGKRCAETLFMDYYRQNNVNIRIARIFNTYGPNMQPDDGRVVSNFIVQALLGQPITIYGDGLQTRSFMFISDLIDGLVRLMDSHLPRPVNLGNPVETTMIDLASKIKALTGSKSEIVYLSLPKDDPRKRNPDITLAKDELRWEPQITLTEGLIKTIEYFRWMLAL